VDDQAIGTVESATIEIDDSPFVQSLRELSTEELERVRNRLRDLGTIRRIERPRGETNERE